MRLDLVMLTDGVVGFNGVNYSDGRVGVELVLVVLAGLTLKGTRRLTH